jgi:nucleoside-diphosphate kinase
MGATNPTVAERGSIRADLGKSITENAVHGSDSPETAREEIEFFFPPNEIFSQDNIK